MQYLSLQHGLTLRSPLGTHRQHRAPDRYHLCMYECVCVCARACVLVCLRTCVYMCVCACVLVLVRVCGWGGVCDTASATISSAKIHLFKILCVHYHVFESVRCLIHDDCCVHDIMMQPGWWYSWPKVGLLGVGLPFVYSPNLVWFAVAVLIYRCFPYDLQAAAVWDKSFILQRLYINVSCGLLWYSWWHLAIYTFHFASRKFNPLSNGPTLPRLLHNIWYCSLGLLIWTAFEVTMIHLMGSGKIAYTPDARLLSRDGLTTVWWVLAMPAFRDLHFYFAHRTIHIRVLYTYVHSLHHRNNDPEPFRYVPFLVALPRNDHGILSFYYQYRQEQTEYGHSRVWPHFQVQPLHYRQFIFIYGFYFSFFCVVVTCFKRLPATCMPFINCCDTMNVGLSRPPSIGNASDYWICVLRLSPADFACIQSSTCITSRASDCRSASSAAPSSSPGISSMQSSRPQLGSFSQQA